MSKISSLTELANFVSKSAENQPYSKAKLHSGFWQAYKSATTSNKKRGQPASVSDLLATVMAISARTRRIVAPKTYVELDVFTPSGKRAVQLIMGQYT